MDKMLNIVKENIYSNNLIQDGDCIVIGLSGGPDSVFLLHILNKLIHIIKEEKNINYTLHAAHVNHKIRVEASYDQNLARKQCEDLNIPFHLLEVDVEAEASRLKIGTEECGRRVRYEFFEQVCKTVNANKIAVAHNAGDNAETIVLNFIRGAGITGLSGMSFETNNIIRPILNVFKEDILNYLEENNIEYAIDKTNLGCDYTRNKVRNELLNKIKSEYNPNIINTLNRMAAINKLDEQIICDAVDIAYNKLNVIRCDNTISIDTKVFNQNSLALRYRLVRKLLFELMGNVQNVEMVHIRDICKLIEANVTNKQYIGGNRYKVIIKKKNMAVFVNNM